MLTRSLQILAVALVVQTAHAQYDTWSVKAAKLTGVSRTAGVGFNGMLYVVGGAINGSTNTIAVESYDSATNTWNSASDAPLALCDHAVARSGSKIYVAGGRTTPTGAAIASVNSFDPGNGIWTARPDLITARFGACAAFDSNTLFVFGGDTGTGTGGSYTNVVEGYSTITDTWSALNPMPTARRGACAAVVGSSIVVVGGEDSGGVTNTVEVYNIAGDSWKTKAPMPAARTQAGCVTVNGILYVVGGRDSSGSDSNSVFIYDLSTNRWLSTPAVAPYSFSGGVVGKVDGNLTIAGGSSATTSTAVYTAPAVSFVVSLAKSDSPASPLGAKFLSYGPPAINAKGHYAYQGKLMAGSGGVPATGVLGIWADHDNTQAKLIAQSGTEAPGTNKSLFVSFSDPVMDDSDNVAFIGKLKPGTGNTTGRNATGIWSDASASGNLELVARVGTAAPDCAFGVNFVAFVSVVLPNSGGTAFVAKVAGPGVKPTNNVGLWADDGNGNVRLVARTGSAIPMPTGGTKVLSAITIFPPSTAVGGQSRSFNQDADFTYRATFTDHTQGLIHVVAP